MAQKSNGVWKNTNVVQTERTETGIITLQQQRNNKTRSTRFIQVGYTSLLQKEDDNGKPITVADGLYGRPLVNTL
jgi:hypothetical protein